MVERIARRETATLMIKRDVVQSSIDLPVVGIACYIHVSEGIVACPVTRVSFRSD